jgi:hypothetical protein
MNTTGNKNRFSKLNTAMLSGILVMSAVALQARAAEQPKPGPEHKKMEVYVGEWTYEGTTEASPFGPADKFKGKTLSRMVLSGFFLDGRSEDKGETGSIYQAVSLTGYDPVNKTHFWHGFENDGNAVFNTCRVSGGTWTSTGPRKDSKGKVYKTRNVDTFSPDGQSYTFLTEYSPDDGKTWLVLWKGTSKKVK